MKRVKKEKVKKEKAKNDKVKRVRQLDYKTWILAGLALVGFIIVVMMILKFNQNEDIDSSYFHDTDDKIVLTMNRDNSELDNSDFEPMITHVVYYHDGNKITNVRAFYEYGSEATAREALEHLELGDFADNKKLNGRFVIFQVKKSQYEDLTVEDLKRDVELLKEIDALVLDYNENTLEEYGEWYVDENDDETVEGGEASEDVEGAE